MKIKKIAILLIALMMISVGLLSGCTEQSGTIGDTDKVNLTKRSVSTHWWEWVKVSDPTQWDSGYELESKRMDGFYHNYPCPTGDSHDPFGIFYGVSGSVENVAGKYLDIVSVTALFLGSNGETLAKETELIYDLPQDRKVFFYISLDRDDTYYFDEIVDVRFDVSVL